MIDNTPTYSFPRQKLSYGAKTDSWRKQHLDWAVANATLFNTSVRSSVAHKKTNINLLNGIVNSSDLKRYVNPSDIDASEFEYNIPHYPIMNSKLNVLVGEESKRPFDYKVVVTNPEAISQKEENKKTEILSKLEQYITEENPDQESLSEYAESLKRYAKYNWQDLREVRANWLLQHYHKELNLPLKFNRSFQLALAVGEESIQCDVVSGEVIVENIDPTKISVFSAGSSLNFEDADIIVLEDYWPLGKIIDYFYDTLSSADISKLEKLQSVGSNEFIGEDPTKAFLPINTDEWDTTLLTGDTFEAMSIQQGITNGYINLFGDNTSLKTDTTDEYGNIRVIRCYWKSKRKILKVKSYDQITGKEVFNFYPEDYIPNVAMGEEATTYWVNEAWEASLVHKDIYTKMGPRKIQYNRISNPSKCHFGIIGSIYSINGNKPYSLVDMMKPHNYLYNVIHDRLNTTLANSWGSLVQLDLASVPKGWTVEKWFHYAKSMKLAIRDSFKEGNEGRAKNTLAGSFGNSSGGVISDNIGNYIEQNIRLLEYIKLELSEISGISKQREGQTANRETFGGIERATLQSSYITEWYYMIHDDFKKRVYECILETAKVAIRDGSYKFQHILNDGAIEMVSIEGDLYSEADYGLVVDYAGSSVVKDKIEMLAQAAMQNQMVSFSSMLSIYNNNNSIADIVKIVREDELNRTQAAQAAQQQELQIKQAELESKAQNDEANRQVLLDNNMRDNQTKLLIKQVELQQSADQQSFNDGIEEPDYLDKDKLLEQIREFDQKLELDRQKHQDTIALKRDELSIKRTVANKKPSNTK